MTVSEEFGTADALRAVSPRITARTCLVISGDLLTDVPVNALVASHQLNGSLATVVMVKRKVSPSTTTKPGKAPKVGGPCCCRCCLVCGGWALE